MTLLRAYRETAYGAHGSVAWVGRRSAGLERLLGRQGGGFITAWNPYSRLQPLGRNRRMNAALEQYLRRWPHWLGVGQGTGWREEHFLVRAAPLRLQVLARRFRQRAIVVVSPPRPPRLVLLARRSAVLLPGHEGHGCVRIDAPALGRL